MSFGWWDCKYHSVEKHNWLIFHRGHCCILYTHPFLQSWENDQRGEKPHLASRGHSFSFIDPVTGFLLFLSSRSLSLKHSQRLWKYTLPRPSLPSYTRTVEMFFSIWVLKWIAHIHIIRATRLHMLMPGFNYPASSSLTLMLTAASSDSARFSDLRTKIFITTCRWLAWAFRENPLVSFCRETGTN